MNFNKNNDSIAVVIKKFWLLKNAERIWPSKYNEIGVISLAVDEHSLAKGEQSKPAIDFNVLPFPMIEAGDSISFEGQGHLIYGPKNPGSFLAYSMLFYECANDTQELGGLIEEIINSKATEVGLKTVLAANPAAGAILSVLTGLADVIAKNVKKTNNRELFRKGGTLFRDTTPPYDILRTYIRSNEWIWVETSITPLQTSNMLGAQPKSMSLGEIK